MTGDIEETLIGLGFRPGDDTLEKRLKKVSHTRWLGGDTYLYWSSTTGKFYLADRHRSYVGGMDVESAIHIPRQVRTPDDARDLVRSLVTR